MGYIAKEESYFNKQHIQSINKQLASGREHYKYLICPLNRAYTVLQ